MVQPPPQTPSLHLGKGQKRSQKQEAVVTGLSTMAPSPRTLQEVVVALRQEPGRLEPAARPQPIGKALRAMPAGPVWPIPLSAGVGRNPRARVGGLINSLSTNFGHTRMKSWYTAL